jgi:hypothetical protein
MKEVKIILIKATKLNVISRISSTDIIKMIKSRTVSLVKHVERMGEIIIKHKFLLGNPEGKQTTRKKLASMVIILQ